MQRKSRNRGRPFYGCSGYPECDFLVNKQPVKEVCKDFGGLMVVDKPGIWSCTVCSSSVQSPVAVAD